MRIIHPSSFKISNQNKDIGLFSVHVLALIGIFYSTAITSISLGLIFLIGLSHWKNDHLRRFYTDRIFIPFLLIFVVALISGWNTEDGDAFHTTLRIKLPFLLLPLSYLLIQPFRSRFALDLHHWLLCITAVVGFPVLIFTLKNYDAMLELVAKGQAIPTPIEHVKYSMFNAYAVITGICLLAFRWSHYSRAQKFFLASASALLILLMHILAVRTGLVILYISILFLGILTFIKYRWTKGFILTVILTVVLPFIAYHSIPTVKQKAGYVLYDWKQYQEGKGRTYSDSERIMLYNVGLQVWKDHALLGVGLGDVKNEVSEYFIKMYDSNGPRKLPHNQFLLYLAGSGIVGLALFLCGFYFPLRKCASLSIEGVLLMMLYLNYTLSFLVENSLERSMSVAFFLLLVLPLMKNAQKQVDNPDL